jgi:sterol desaturase/sphingolipid hydroxylase (fatty acid hydroxylase superfamily)
MTADTDRRAPRVRATVAWAVWPVLVVGTLAGAWWGIAAGIPVPVWAFVVSAANVVVILALEQVLPARARVNPFRDPQVPRDIGHGVLIGALGRPVASRLAAGAIAVVAVAAAGTRRPHLWPTNWPAAAQVASALAVWSFVGYWTHRTYHRVGFLWKFHAVHHDVTHMQVFKGNRIHLGEDVVRQFAGLLPLVALGVSNWVLVWIALWNNVEGSAAHANIEQRLPSWAHRVLPTPQNHYVHHAIERELYDANFAAVSPLWDIVFGTFRHPDANPVAGVGIEGAPVPEGFVAQLRFPFVAA